MRKREIIGMAVATIGVAAASGAPARAFTPEPGWDVQRTPGSHDVRVDPNVTGVQVIVVGGRGGGAAGGAGAVVRAELPLGGGRRPLWLRVGSDGGDVGRALPAGIAPAGLGGDSSAVIACAGGRQCSSASLPDAIAAGGGGSGGGTALFPGGAGGAAGAPGAAGVTGTRRGAAGGGGSAGTSGVGGSGGAGGLLPIGCVGVAGRDGGDGGPRPLFSFERAGNGGLADDPARDGGGGGAGADGGGGGGSAASCDDEQARGSGGGGGGGASRVPAGGTIELDPSPSGPLVAYRFVRDTVAPVATVSAPRDGGSYVARTVVAASYACADEAGGAGMKGCVGTVRAGRPIDTRTPGEKTFTVTARDRAGNVATTTVRYTVSPVPAPTPDHLAVSPRAFRFTLSAPGWVTLRVERRATRGSARWVHVRTLGHRGGAGANTVAFRARIGRRRLVPGRYRVVLHTRLRDQRSAPLTLRFRLPIRR